MRTANSRTNEGRQLEALCPSLPQLVERVFKQRWTRFEIMGPGPRLDDDIYPGVYVLAYEKENLSGKPVHEKDIYYVGMSLIALRKRLRQFRCGLLDGHHHSAAKRFFLSDECGGKPFDDAKTGKQFFVASVSIPCRYRKPDRNGTDLRKLGIVAALEFHVLGRVKDKTSEEPPLNKK